MNSKLVSLSRKATTRILLQVVIATMLLSLSAGVATQSGYAQAPTPQQSPQSPAEATTLSAPTTPLGSMLNPDGTLNLESGFSGSLDARGWKLDSAPGAPPRFAPSASERKERETSQPLDPGDENWDGKFGTPDVNDVVNAVAVSITGDVYIGGNFTTAGGSTANYIAKYNRDGWSSLGSGMNNSVYTIAVSSAGDVYAGGGFTIAGGVSANNIAKWNGSAWSALGSGTDSSVFSIAINNGTGDLYAGGLFTHAGGASAVRIAMWDGSTWSPLGSGMNSYVKAVAVSSTGDVYAGGLFSVAGGVNANGIAKWDGSAWSALGAGVDNIVRTIAVSGTGDIYAGGDFTTTGSISVNRIAKWNGSAWSALGTGLNNDVSAVAVSSTGEVYAGGDFTTAGGMNANHIAEWNGSAWSALSYGLELGDAPTVNAIGIVPTGEVYVGGLFAPAGLAYATDIAMWEGSVWSPLGSGMDNFVYAIAVDGITGDVYVGGEFLLPEAYMR